MSTRINQSCLPNREDNPIVLPKQDSDDHDAPLLFMSPSSEGGIANFSSEKREKILKIVENLLKKQRFKRLKTYFLLIKDPETQINAFILESQRSPKGKEKECFDALLSVAGELAQGNQELYSEMLTVLMLSTSRLPEGDRAAATFEVAFKSLFSSRPPLLLKTLAESIIDLRPEERTGLHARIRALAERGDAVAALAEALPLLPEEFRAAAHADLCKHAGDDRYALEAIIAAIRYLPEQCRAKAHTRLCSPAMRVGGRLVEQMFEGLQYLPESERFGAYSDLDRRGASLGKLAKFSKYLPNHKQAEVCEDLLKKAKHIKTEEERLYVLSKLPDFLSHSPSDKRGAFASDLAKTILEGMKKTKNEGIIIRVLPVIAWCLPHIPPAAQGRYYESLGSLANRYKCNRNVQRFFARYDFLKPRKSMFRKLLGL